MMHWFFEHGFVVAMPAAAVRECSAPGRRDEAVARWAREIERPRECTPAALRAELRETGAWEEDELRDDAQNWERIIWIAACNIKEDPLLYEEED
jgi:hypothetical protein